MRFTCDVCGARSTRMVRAIPPGAPCRPLQRAALTLAAPLTAGLPLPPPAQVNPLALAKGTVFVQCANAECGKFHQLVDNLDLIDEVVYANEEGGRTRAAAAEEEGEGRGQSWARRSRRVMHPPSPCYCAIVPAWTPTARWR